MSTRASERANECVRVLNAAHKRQLTRFGVKRANLRSLRALATMRKRANARALVAIIAIEASK